MKVQLQAYSMLNSLLNTLKKGEHQVSRQIFTIAAALGLATSWILATVANAQDTKHYRFAHDQQLNSGYSIAYDLFSVNKRGRMTPPLPSGSAA